MARILFSGLITSISGKINGSVIQVNHNETAQLRTKVVPRNPQTLTQQVVRGSFGTNSALWRSLTSTQQQDWRDAVTTGATGNALFTASNVNASLIESTPITDWTPGPNPDAMEIAIENKTTMSVSFTCQGAVQTVPADCRLLISAAHQQPGSRFFFPPSAYTPVIWYEEGTNMAASVFITPELVTKIGTLVPGNSFSLRSTVINKINGLASIFPPVSAVIEP